MKGPDTLSYVHSGYGEKRCLRVPLASYYVRLPRRVRVYRGFLLDRSYLSGALPCLMRFGPPYFFEPLSQTGGIFLKGCYLSLLLTTQHFDKYTRRPATL